MKNKPKLHNYSTRYGNLFETKAIQTVKHLLFQPYKLEEEKTVSSSKILCRGGYMSFSKRKISLTNETEITKQNNAPFEVNHFTK